MSIATFSSPIQTSKLHHEVYGKKNVEAYAKYSATNHGADGALFLDKYFKPAIEHLQGEKILDIGCGAGPWSVYAAKQGGDVYAIDIQPEMIEAAKQRVKEENLEEKVKLSVGDAAALAYGDNFFDCEISICVGCNLPEGIFEKSFTEMARTLKQDGIAVVGTPYSLDVVFTNGSLSSDEVKSHIDRVLDTLPDHPSHDQITEKLSELTEVLSGTFYLKEGRLALVTDEKELREGEKIWRKLPKPIVPNRYHSKEAYEKAFKASGLKLARGFFRHFANEEKRITHNSRVAPGEQLGEEYVSHAPFAVYYLTKE